MPQTTVQMPAAPGVGELDRDRGNEGTQRQLRAALRTFATGVTVVTSAGCAGQCAVTVTSFTWVSLNPPLVLVCLDVASAAARTIARNGVLAVNVLSVEQEWLSRRFASRRRPRGSGAFAGVTIQTGRTGAPVLGGVVCWLDCRYVGTLAAGDHVVVLGEILDFADGPSDAPLLVHAGRYRTVGDPLAPPPGLTAFPTPMPERR